jgi:hypothetical protein
MVWAAGYSPDVVEWCGWSIRGVCAHVSYVEVRTATGDLVITIPLPNDPSVPSLF